MKKGGGIIIIKRIFTVFINKWGDRVSKYYVLMQDSKNYWSIQASLNQSYYKSSNTFGFRTYIEQSMVDYDISNIRAETTRDITRMKVQVKNSGMDYYTASAIMKEITSIQAKDLKDVKNKYKKSHTVKVSVISKSHALNLINALVVIPEHAKKHRVKITKRNSIDSRRFAKYHSYKAGIYKKPIVKVRYL